MPFGQVWINVDCSGGRLVRRCRAFRKREYAKRAEPTVVGRDTGIRYRIVWIEGDGLLITNNCLGESFLGERIPIEATAQVCFVGLWIVGAALRQTQTFIHSQVWNNCF